MTDSPFDGHLSKDFRFMTPQERLEDLSRKTALVLELRRARLRPPVPPQPPEDV